MQNRISYQHLQPEDRMTIASMRQQDCSVRAMARTLQRSASTITRELGRNTVGAQPYGSHLAQQACVARQRAARPAAKEGDFIKGAGNKSSVGVLVERSSRLVLLARMEDATAASTAASALAGFTVKLNSIAAPMRYSFTYNQGKEMSRHQQLALNTGVRVYFCDPHSPWQRATCENTNGLLRQYLPKGTDLSVYSQEELDAIADSLNTRPRATHGFNTPLAIFSHMLAMAQQAPSSVQ